MASITCSKGSDKSLSIELSLMMKAGKYTVCVADADEGKFYDVTKEEQLMFVERIKEYGGSAQDVKTFKTTLDDLTKERNAANKAAAPAQAKAKGSKSAGVGTHEGALERKKAEMERQKQQKELNKSKPKVVAKTKAKAAAKPKPKSKPKPKPKPASGRASSSAAASTDDDDDDDDDDEDEEDEEDEEEEEEEEGGIDADVDLIGPLNMATRAPSKNARGHQRILGKSKRSSEFVANHVDSAGAKKKKSRGKVDGKPSSSVAVPVLPGAETLFRAQRTGSRGIKAASRKHSQRASILPTMEQLQEFRKKLPVKDPLLIERQALAAAHLKSWSQWLWYMQLNFNLLFFGVGCKRELIEEFVADRLYGEDVLCIDGGRQQDYAGGGGGGGLRTIKALLDAICSIVLKQPAMGAACLSLDGHVRAVVTALDQHYGRNNSGSGVGGVVASAPAAAAAVAAAAASAASKAASTTISASNFANSSVDGADADAFRWTGLYDDAAAAAAAAGPRLVRSTSLQSSGSSSLEAAISGEADPAWGGRYVHAQAKLYVVIHSIDGECLQSPEAQRALAWLADCASVSILASFDKVNTPLLWGNDELSKFRWAFLHVPTYTDYEIRPDFALYAGTKGPAGHGHALEYILSSLTNDHRQLVGILAADALQRLAKRAADGDGHAGSAASRGIPFEELLSITAKKLIAQNKERLTTLLKELEDHRLLTVTGDARRQQVVVMQLPVEQMQKIRESGI